ncbi:MAG: hypothetical protein KJP04_10100 [Arenicella sp.]|nr:hypothetical protein [Arenicella sp.]
MSINSPTGCNLELIDGHYYLCIEGSEERVRISRDQALAIQAIRRTPRVRNILAMALLASLFLLAFCGVSGTGIYI